MKLSKYNVLFEVDGKWYLYNLLSTALVEIEKDVADAIEKNDVLSIASSYVTAMAGMHLVVDDSIDEAQEYLFYFNAMKYRIGTKTLGLIFIPTYNCNLACPYCLQGLKKEKKIISNENLKGILSFVEKQMLMSQREGFGINKINVTIYGGEPFLAKHQLIVFCDELHEIASSNKALLNIQIVTNFTLLDDDIITLIKKYNISVQVSVDGLKGQHDKTRIRQDGNGTFDIIINNLKKMSSEGLKQNVVIRINVNEDNLSDLDEIMGSVREYSDDVYFAFVDKYKGFNDGFDCCLSHQGYSDILTKKIYPIYEKYNLLIHRAFGKESPCSICTENRFVVDANLDVYKCEVLVNQQDAKVGTIDNKGDLLLNNNFYKQMSLSPEKDQKCRDCKLLPLCGGGCVGKAYINRALKDSNFECRECKMQMSDLLVFLKDHVKRKAKKASV